MTLLWSRGNYQSGETPGGVVYLTIQLWRRSVTVFVALVMFSTGLFAQQARGTHLRQRATEFLRLSG